MSESNTTLLVAVISAAVALFGYFYQKRQEREFTLATTRREIYQRLVKNLYQGATLIPVALKDPKVAAAQSVEEKYALVRELHPNTWKNVMEGLEISALLCIYGTDPAVQKAAAVRLQGAQLMQELSKPAPDLSRVSAPDLPGLVLVLRKSVYGASRELEQTVVTREEIAQLLTA